MALAVPILSSDSSLLPLDGCSLPSDSGLQTPHLIGLFAEKMALLHRKMGLLGPLVGLFFAHSPLFSIT
jgi:hypothetical protein